MSYSIIAEREREIEKDFRKGFNIYKVIDCYSTRSSLNDRSITNST